MGRGRSLWREYLGNSENTTLFFRFQGGQGAKRVGRMRIGRVDMGVWPMVMRVEMRIAVAVVMPLAKAVVDVVHMAHGLCLRLQPT